MTEYQQFAAGFLAECVALGLDLPQIKRAAARLPQLCRAKQAGLLDNLLNTGASLSKWGLLTAAAAPPLLGAAAGHALARTTDVDPEAAANDLNSEERIAAYTRETERLRRLRRRTRPLDEPAAPTLG